MRGNEIVLTGSEYGKRIEGTLSGATYPGQIVTAKAGTFVGGRGIWQAATFTNPAASGGRGPAWAVLDLDALQGGSETQQYADGARCFLQFALPGDEFNLLVKNIAGTGDHFAIGDVLMVEHTSGKLIAATGSPTGPLFTVQETVAALTADTLVWVMYGN
jgi:hypothetical protein